MIFMNFFLSAFYSFFGIFSSNKHKYESFITNFIENTFDNNYEVICIKNSEEKEIRIKKTTVFENIKKIDSKTLSSDIFTMVKLIENRLDERDSSPKKLDDNLDKLFRPIIWNQTDCSKEEYIKSLQDALDKISGHILNDFSKEIDFFPKNILESIKRVGLHLNTFDEINKNIMLYFLVNKQCSTVHPIFMEFKNQVGRFKKLINEEIARYELFTENEKNCRSKITDVLNKLKRSLPEKIEEISRMSENMFKNKLYVLGETHTLFCNLNFYNKKHYEPLSHCYDSSRKILNFLKEDKEEKLWSYKSELTKNK